MSCKYFFFSCYLIFLFFKNECISWVVLNSIVSVLESEFLLACVVFVRCLQWAVFIIFMFYFIYFFYLCFKIRLFFCLHIIEVVKMLCSWEMGTFSTTFVSRRRICNPIRTIRFVVQKLNEFVLRVVKNLSLSDVSSCYWSLLKTNLCPDIFMNNGLQSLDHGINKIIDPSITYILRSKREWPTVGR